MAGRNDLGICIDEGTRYLPAACHRIRVGLQLGFLVFNDLHHRQLRDSLGQPSRFFALLTRVRQMAVHVRSHATALLHLYRLHRHRLGFGWKLPLGSGRMGSHGSGLALGQSRR